MSIVNRNSFKEALDFARICINSKGFIPILSHICITPKTLSSFNGIEGIIVNFETGLNCAIPGDVITKLINSLSVDDIQLIETEGKVSVKAGQSSTKIASLSSSHFIMKAPPCENVPTIKITPDFIMGIQRCLVTVNTDPAKQNQYGVVLNNSTLYSTDNIRISKYVLEEQLSFTEKLLLPKVFCELLVNLANKIPEIKGNLRIGNSYLSADFGNIQLFSEKICDISFLDFEKVINTTQLNNNILQKKPSKIFSILERSSLVFSPSEEKILNVEVGNKFIEFTAQGTYGTHSEELEADLNFTGKFRIDVQYLEELLDNIEEFNFTNAGTKIIIRGEDSNYLQLLTSLPL